jgi:hypothetical protein
MFILICSFSPITSLISQFSFKRLKNPHCWNTANISVKHKSINQSVYIDLSVKNVYTKNKISFFFNLPIYCMLTRVYYIDIFVFNANVSSISAYWATSWRWCKQTHILYHVKIMSCNECTNRWYHIYYNKYLITCVHQ